MKPDERAAISDADTEYQLTDRALISMIRGAAAEGICGRLHESHFVRLCDLADECDRLCEEVATARGTGNFWKMEKVAADKEIDRLCEEVATARGTGNFWKMEKVAADKEIDRLREVADLAIRLRDVLDYGSAILANSGMHFLLRAALARLEKP